jgi:hypothetical protein
LVKEARLILETSPEEAGAVFWTYLTNTFADITLTCTLFLNVSSAHRGIIFFIQIKIKKISVKFIACFSIMDDMFNQSN